MEAMLSVNEAVRLDALHHCQILDTPPEREYDEITLLASQICDTPIALVSFVDSERQWFKSKIGLEVSATPRATAFCAHAILQPNDLLIVQDATQDERFAQNPLVTGDPSIRFYAGAPIISSEGAALGTLCVIDRKPRRLDKKKKDALRALSRQVMAQLELRRKVIELENNIELRQQVELALRESEDRFTTFMNNSPAVAFMKDAAGRYVYVNQTLEQIFNVQARELIGRTDFDWLPEATARQVRDNDRMVISTNKPSEVIETVSTPDGTQNYWLSLKFPFIDREGYQFVGGVSLNITDWKNAEERLNESERRYRHLIEHSQGFICIHDLDGQLLTINPAAARVLGYQPEEMVGGNLREFLSSSAQPFFGSYLMRMKKNLRDEGLMVVMTKDGRERTWKYDNFLYQETGAIPHVIGHAQDITDLLHAQEELRNLSLTDDLTNLYNRRGFYTLAAQALKVTRRTKRDCLVLYADLNGLKKVNDTLGHDAGSTMIVETARLLKESFRESDIIARLGGDEFAVFINNSAAHEIDIITARLQSTLDKFNSQQGRSHKLSLSVGIISLSSTNATSIEELVMLADEQMYVHKKQKRQTIN